MKAIKRLFAVMLALIIGTATATAASAAGEGTITINNTTAEATYSVYKIADLVEYDEDSGVYYYRVERSSAWFQFLSSVAESYGIKLTQEYDGSDNYYVRWPGEPSAESVSDFVSKAINFAEGADILPEATDVAEGDTLKFSGLELGWYLVDSSVGALTSLTTTDPDAEVNDKNNTPSIVKKVWEDYTSEDDRWVKKATIDTTDTISYQLTVNVGQVASDDYDITDKLAGFIAESLSALSRAEVTAFYQSLGNTISVVGFDSEANEVSLSNRWSFDYDAGVTDEFYITLSKDVLSDESLDLAQVIITYSIAPSYYGGDTTAFTNMTVGEIYNAEVTLGYNEFEYTDYAGVVTYNGGTRIYKVDEDDKEALEGVGFTLAKVVDDTTTVYAQVDSNNVVTAWVSDKSSATTIYTDANGNLRVDGLDADEYIWTEVAPLYGYANISYTVTMWIDLDGKVTYAPTGDSDRTPGEEITVVNRVSGSLPGTGGMGTTIFYIVGTILVAGALVGFLVVRLRKNSEKATAIA